jgi:AcrR family transcriptional regulator
VEGVAERGRPREFDTEAALDQAVVVFWRHGYEGTSMTELTTAMGINKPSLYAAFGNKEELFRTAVQRYAETDLAYAREALDEPTAYQVAVALFRSNIEAVTRPGRPLGCFWIQGGLACAEVNTSVVDFLAASRLAGEAELATRFERALAEGDLPTDADPAALARFVMTVVEGQAVHAAGGVGRADLERSAAIALRAFPRQ